MRASHTVRHQDARTRRRALESECGTEEDSGKEARMGDAGGSAGLGVACCASVLWMLANLRCSRSTCARPRTAPQISPAVWSK